MELRSNVGVFKEKEGCPKIEERGCDGTMGIDGQDSSHVDKFPIPPRPNRS